MYCDPLGAPGGHKITARQRWTPTPMQLQILERIFDQGNGTPSKQKIKEITIELSQHGQISETNVYNWFQNRRARSKRKQVCACHFCLCCSFFFLVSFLFFLDFNEALQAIMIPTDGCSVFGRRSCQCCIKQQVLVIKIRKPEMLICWGQPGDTMLCGNSLNTLPAF